LKIAGHARNEQYQQYEQRPAAQRGDIVRARHRGVADAIARMIGNAAAMPTRRRFRPVIACNPPRNA